jgi:hypothetical protein
MNILTSLFGSSPGGEHPKPIKPLFPKPVTRDQVENKLHELTEYPIWDWECLRSVLICLAKLGEGRYIPATRRPNCVFLDGFQATFTELRQISAQRQGRETSRVVLADRDRSCLVISGKTHVGSTSNVKINMTAQPGREMVQLPVLAIHVHPDQARDVGFSDRDYVSFLSDQRLIIMAICFRGGILVAMKTSATPRVIAPETAQRLISISRDDIMSIWSNLHLPEALLAFNKAVCTEFGMTLYQTTDLDQNVARRIEVTNF